MTKSATIRLRCTQQDKEQLDERGELRGYNSLSDYIRQLLNYGLLVEEALDGKPLNAYSFAGAFYNMAEKLMQIGTKHVLEQKTAEELLQWKTDVGERRVVSGKVLRPARK